MSGNKPAHIFRQKLPSRRAPSPNRLAAFIGLLAILLGAASLLAQSPTSPTKEYIRAGGKLIAIEIPGAAAAISVSVTPQTAPALGPSGTQQFAASVSGSSNQTVTWIVASGLGSISPTGLYTAPSTITSTSSATVRATSQADTSKFASVTLTLRPVASAPTPLVTYLTPSTPTTQDVTFNLNAQGGSADVSQLRLYLGFDGTDVGDCLILYDRLTHTLLLRSDGAGESWLTAIGIGSSQTQENSQCKIFGSGSSAANFGRNTQLAVRVQAKPAFAGNRVMKVWLNNTNNQSWGWADVGNWIVPASTNYVTPPVRSLFPGQFVQLTSVTTPAGQNVTWSMSPSVGTLSTTTGFYTAPASISSQQTVTVTARRQSDNSVVGAATLTLKPVSGSGLAPAFAELVPGTSQRNGLAEVFKFRLTDQQGPLTIDEVRVRFTPSTNTTNANNCSFRWSRNGSVLELFNDAGTKLEGPIGTGTPNLSNSACTLIGASLNAYSWGTPGGYNPFELILGIGFQGAFASGTKNIEVSARDNTGRELALASRGTWTFSSSGSAPSLVHTTTGGYPQGVGTTTQKFAITITDANGASDINDIQFVITDRTTFPQPNTCHIFYFPGSDVALTLADDGLQWADIGELNPGWPFQSNSQCDFFVSDTDYVDGTSPSTQKVFRPKFRLKGSFATSSKSVYAKVSDNSGLATAYQYVTSFTVNGSSNQPVYFTPRSEIDPITGKPRVWVEITGADSVEPHAETGLGREEE